MSLLGDKVVELLFGHNTVSVSVGSLNHLLESIVVSQLSQIFGNFSEIFKSNETCIVSLIPVFALSKVMNTLWTSSRD
jgi:hypothetical protein